MPAAKPSASPRSAGQPRAVWSRLAVLVFLLPAAAVLLPTTILLSVLMLPTVCAWIVDRVPGRSLAVSIGLLNGAGTVPGIVRLWSGGHDLATMSTVLGDPFVWLSAYLAAAAAWLIFLMLPPLLRRYYEFATQSRLNALQKRQDKLREEWGEAVAEGAPTTGRRAGARADEAESEAEPPAAKKAA